MLPFTVFTPTYNRRDTLGAVYRSLVAQTRHDFEWLVVDDGSTDGSAEHLRDLTTDAPFPVVVLRQDNQGKPAAFNAATAVACGELFVPLDSDDECVPHALERFWAVWESIPASRREEFSGVGVLSATRAGAVIGDPYPASPLDMKPVEMLARYRLRGDKWGCHRTELLRRFPFPRFEGETFVPEGLVWNRLGARYAVRHVNEALRVCEYRTDGLSAQGWRLRARNPRGTLLYYGELAELASSAPLEMHAVANSVRFALHARRHPGAAVEGATAGRSFAARSLGWAMGSLAYVKDRASMLLHGRDVTPC